MNWASQVWPFAHEMKKGEIVVLPSKIKPVIHFGKITGDYEFLPNNDNPYYHAHQVDWFACDILRTAFDQDILYSFGAFMTICRIKQEDRIKAVIHAQKQGKKRPKLLRKSHRMMKKHEILKMKPWGYHKPDNPKD